MQVKATDTAIHENIGNVTTAHIIGASAHDIPQYMAALSVHFCLS